MSIYEACKKRDTKGEGNSKDRKIWQMRNTFDKYLNQSPTGVTVKFTYPDEFPILDNMHEELVIINDVLANDKRSFDEKLIKARYDTKLDVGCYFFLDNSWWLIVFKDRKEMDTKKSFIAKLCNQFIRYEYKNNIYDLPVLMEDDTNSDGLQQVKYATTIDTRRKITYGANYITKTISVGKRFMIKNKDVYKITNISDFEYNGMFTGSDGIITASMSEVLLEPNDNEHDNLADNYNKIDNKCEGYIIGEHEIYIGSKNTYKYIFKEKVTLEWGIEEPILDGVTLEVNGDTCTIKCKLNEDIIGDKIVLYVVDKDTNSKYLKEIIVRGL